MVVFIHRVITGLVVGTQECPAAVAALVRGAGVEQVTVEEESIPWIRCQREKSKHVISALRLWKLA